jgi:hypothetical protein
MLQCLYKKVHLFVLDAPPVDKFTSLVADASIKGCKPLFIIKRIDDDLLPLTNVDQVSVDHFCFESYIVPLLVESILNALINQSPYTLND